MVLWVPDGNLRKEVTDQIGTKEYYWGRAAEYDQGPKILVTDEPCLGLAEAVSRRVYEAIKKLHDAGKTILLIEENPVRALQISGRALRVERGMVDEAPGEERFEAFVGQLGIKGQGAR